MPSHEEIVTIYGEEVSNQDKYGKETHLFPVFPSGGQATVWLKGESGQEGTLFDFKNKEFRPLYKSKSGRMSVRLVRFVPYIKVKVAVCPFVWFGARC